VAAIMKLFYLNSLFPLSLKENNFSFNSFTDISGCFTGSFGFSSSFSVYFAGDIIGDLVMTYSIAPGAILIGAFYFTYGTLLPYIY